MTYFYLLSPQCKKWYHWIGTECVYRNLHIFHTFTSIFKTFFSVFPSFLEAKHGINFVCLHITVWLYLHIIFSDYAEWGTLKPLVPHLFPPITLGFALSIILVVSTRLWLGLLQISPEEGMIYIYLAKDSTIMIVTSWIRERGLQALDHLASQMSRGPWPLLWDLSEHISLNQSMESVNAEYLQFSERESKTPPRCLLLFIKILADEDQKSRVLLKAS